MCPDLRIGFTIRKIDQFMRQFTLIQTAMCGLELLKSHWMTQNGFQEMSRRMTHKLIQVMRSVQLWFRAAFIADVFVSTTPVSITTEIII
jgi:hypothetical protein